MREFFLAILFLAAALLAGCGGISPAPVAARANIPAPHGGTIIPVPDNRGYGEFLLEPPPKPGGKAAGSAIVVYFLGPDGKSPMAPAPSSVSVSYTVDRATKTVNLSHKPNADDPAGRSRFATDPLSLAENRLEGDLNATIQGDAVSLPITIR
jgi:hypothetical protein